MLQNESELLVADNTGAKLVLVIRKLGGGGGNRKFVNIGDLVDVTVKEAAPHGMVKKGTVHTAIIVRSKKGISRETGEFIRFSDNAVVLLKEDGSPRGTRIFGPIAREIREAGEETAKIISLAQEVV